MTGLRIALGFSFVLAISSEMIAANSGIGKLIFMYGENGAYDYMFAAIAAWWRWPSSPTASCSRSTHVPALARVRGASSGPA